EHGFRLTASALQEALTPRSKGLILNDPSNPAGAVYPPEELKALGEVCREAGIWVIADEVYECLVYEGRHYSLAALVPGGQDRMVLVNGVSKSHAMTGWRLGYAVGPREVVAAMGSLQEHVTGNASSISQWAAVAALTGSQETVKTMEQEFARRRAIMVEGLNRIPGFRCIPPAGAFYAFADVGPVLGREVRGRQLTDDVTLAELLLEEALVAAVPGTAFGYPGYMRFSFATSVEKITEGLQRLHHLLR
ncbi:MAG TPA: aminotransferase class I/II-fold pyridoxal phosphate-dependent enzyme, partial [Firmicutes bacterium]|nr:aminotransferase class I/II-fold pyridoxal phosphate-dependent enzyme [Bacillota bacterium]